VADYFITAAALLIVVQCASSTSLVTDVAKVRLGGSEICRMGLYCVCVFFSFDGL
jgi:hypothetical protein